MASVMITGSTDGLGLMAARLLLDEGCTTPCWPSRWPGTGQRCCPTRWSPAGCPPGWAVLAPRDDLALAPVTQAWLAVSDDPAAMVTGGYFYHQRPREPNPAARDTGRQEALLAYCADLSGTPLPAV